MDFDLELEKVASEIKKARAKKVLIQLPDGLKPRAIEIAEELKKLSKAEILIWFGSNYGACDVPSIENQKIDLIVNFGHSSQ